MVAGAPSDRGLPEEGSMFESWQEVFFETVLGIGAYQDLVQGRNGSDEMEGRSAVARIIVRQRRPQPSLDGEDGPYPVSGMAVEPFADAELRYLQLVASRKSGQLSAKRFRDEVRSLAVTDGESKTWILGPEDGQWHRRVHDRWVTEIPPRRFVCPGCRHHNLTRHSFCVECGTALSAVGSKKTGSDKVASRNK